jgi:hypothetical protein
MSAQEVVALLNEVVTGFDEMIAPSLSKSNVSAYQ